MKEWPTLKKRVKTLEQVAEKFNYGIGVVTSRTAAVGRNWTVQFQKSRAPGY